MGGETPIACKNQINVIELFGSKATNAIVK